MKITKDMPIGEAIRKYPQIIPIFIKYHLTCMGCPMAMSESIADGAKAHGINVEKLMKEINDTLQN